MSVNPISHLTLGTNDVQRAVSFYDPVLQVMGFKRLDRPAEKPPCYCRDNDFPYIYIYPPFDEKPATVGNGSHLALQAENRAQVDRFYAAAMANGGSDEGAPGLRPHYSENYYAAYVRDPDGNKLQAVCYAPEG